MGRFNIKKKFKNALKYYPEEDELPIDWCPICEEKLPDKTRKTRIAHNNEKHPPDPKVRKRHIRDVLISVAVIGVLLSGMLFFISEIEGQKANNQYCIEQRNELNSIVRETKVYPFDEQARIDMLVEKCNLGFSLLNYTGYNPSDQP